MFLNCADLVLMLTALGAAIVLNYAPEADMSVSAYSIDFLSTRVKLSNAVLCGLMLIVWHFCFKIYGMYYSNRLSNSKEVLKQIIRAVAVSSIILLSVAQIGGWETLNLWTVFCFFCFGVLFVSGMRLGVYQLSRAFRRRGINKKTLLVIGGGNRAKKLIEKLTDKMELGYDILGYLDSEPSFSHRRVAGSPWLGKFEDLQHIINTEVIDEVAIALPIKSQYAQIKTSIGQLEEQGIVVHLLSDFFPHHLSRVQQQEFQGMPLLIAAKHTAVLLAHRV